MTSLLTRDVNECLSVHEPLIFTVTQHDWHVSVLGVVFKSDDTALS